MKKAFTVIAVLIFAAVCFTGCGFTKKTDSGKLSVVSTIFPAYDFAKQICGDYAEVTLLLPPGTENHSYEPRPQDIIRIQNCDLFIYVGGESDTWVTGILDSMDTPVRTIRMADCVTTVEEEIKEGMETGERDNAESDGETEAGYDEHVWTSPANAVKITESISKEICRIDPDNKEEYIANTSVYTDKLNKLDADFTGFFSTVKNKTLIFGDRFPFRYFADEYGLDYYAAFPGCSSETEPSAATVAFLIDKVKEQSITTVFYIEFSNHRIADSIAEETGVKTALFHSCHNVSQDDFDNGVTYISLMEQNLSVLKEAMK